MPWSIVLGQLDPMGKSYIGQDFFREINFTEKNRIVTDWVHKIGFWVLLPGISPRKKCAFRQVEQCLSCHVVS